MALVVLEDDLWRAPERGSASALALLDLSVAFDSAEPVFNWTDSGDGGRVLFCKGSPLWQVSCGIGCG